MDILSKTTATNIKQAALGAVLISIVLTGTGCQYLSDMKVSKQLFRQNIMACTQAVSRGDLKQAEIHLSAARPLAKDERQQMQLRSLETLLEGAEALMEGNGPLAQSYFSRIEDPYLRREVRAKARRINLQVPLSPIDSTGGVQ